MWRGKGREDGVALFSSEKENVLRITVYLRTFLLVRFQPNQFDTIADGFFNLAFERMRRFVDSFLSPLVCSEEDLVLFPFD